ncbi:PAS domain S-box-containing protein [Desulfocicer vacuolatum DSM 3385]|uniref:histidine kinase n=1 Tax=Desulfocicer vacuolatum DSM 3385 TaxID=1121400 RepID=A0A1W1YPZ6_9BACT|nr:PAS domain S-box protein [Desulfocicer vacuolatum]SMC37881.1 PAS domain S-box-containing protein [Desulfocicer vacuolatum DSM 3385]
MQHKHPVVKLIFSEPITRLLIYFMAILILSSTAQIMVENLLLSKLESQNKIVENQRAKQKIGELIQQKIILLELNFRQMLLSRNPHAIKEIALQSQKHIASLKKMLIILQRGGMFIETMQLNLNRTDLFQETISYTRDTPGEMAVEVINISPKLAQLEKILLTVTTLLLDTLDQPTTDTSLENGIAITALEADPLFRRCRENANKISHDTSHTLARLIQERNQQKQNFQKIRNIFFVLIQIFVITMMVLILFRIMRILNQRKIAEDKNKQLLSAIKLSPLTFIITDKNGIIEYVNHAFEKSTGYSAKEAIGQSTRIMKSGQYDNAFYREMWQTLLSGQIWNREIQNRRKNGELFWESATIIPLYDEDGSINQFLAIKEDMTEKINLLKSYEEANEVFEEIFSNLPVGIVIVNTDKEILQINAEAEQILGYAPNEAEHFLKNRVCHGNYCTLKSGECPIFEGKKSKLILEEKYAIKKDGTTIPILKSVIPIKLKGKRVLLEAFMDLSARKQAETAMIEAKTAAETANKAKSEFLATMSHEIRTPMNAIMGFTDLLLSEESGEDKKEKLKIISESAHNLLQLINDILDFSKIEAGKIELANLPFSMKALLNQVHSLFVFKAKEKSLELVLDIREDMPEYALGDELRVQQILINLLGNAIKFTQNGSIRIHADHRDTHFFLQVEDSGVGIPKKSINHIFESFRQADSSTVRKYGGTGLGLAISSSLVKLMGGRIEVSSEPDKGSCFSIHLPLATPESKNTESPDPVQDKKQPFLAKKKIRVLVVEDNAFNLKIVTAMLKRMHIEHDSAENGAVAMTMLGISRYDLVLLDMHMPVMDGMETIAAIRNTPELKNIIVIALTANAIVGDREKYIKAGCNDYLSKPLKREAFQEKIQSIFPDIF